MRLPRLVAVAEVRTLAWEIEVALDGHSRGTLLLRADTGAMLVFSPAAHFGPDDTVSVEIRARTFASDFFADDDPNKQVVADIDVDPVTGEPLLGSTYTPLACEEDPNALPACGQTRLGNPQIVVLDADHQNFYGDKTSHPRIAASPTGDFLATPPATAKDDSPMRDDAALQDFFYRLQASYSLIDGFHAGKWDAFRGSSSGFPVTAYKPRVVLAHNTNILLTCGFSQPGCAKVYWPFVVDVPPSFMPSAQPLPETCLSPVLSHARRIARTTSRLAPRTPIPPVPPVPARSQRRSRPSRPRGRTSQPSARTRRRLHRRTPPIAMTPSVASRPRTGVVVVGRVRAVACWR